jgi:hypothetical protein
MIQRPLLGSGRQVRGEELHFMCGMRIISEQQQMNGVSVLSSPSLCNEKQLRFSSELLQPYCTRTHTRTECCIPTFLP